MAEGNPHSYKRSDRPNMLEENPGPSQQLDRPNILEENPGPCQQLDRPNMLEEIPGPCQQLNRPNMLEENPGPSQRIFKKSSSNNKITLYIENRDLVLEPLRAHRVEGVLLVDPEYANNRNIYGQIIVTFRYGREDEEIMGLQFYNESVVNMVRIWPSCDSLRSNVTMSSRLQTLARRLGPNAVPFHIELFNTAPPSMVLLPTKAYHGKPVGTSYDIRITMSEEPGDLVSRPVTLRMGFRVTHSALRIDTAPLLTPSPSKESFRVKPRYQRFKVRRRRSRPPPYEDPSDPVTEDEYANVEYEAEEVENNAANDREDRIDYMERSENEEDRSDDIQDMQMYEDFSIETEPAVLVPRPAPRVTVEKSFLLSDGKLILEAWLDKSSYHHGDRVIVNFRIENNSKKTVRRIKAYCIQYVDVCMFNNGKFKNVVAKAKDDSFSVPPGQHFHDYYSMKPGRVPTQNWIALEAPIITSGDCLASSVVCEPEEAKRRGISTIFVSYYVKLTLFMNRLGGELSVKLPFSLSHALKGCASDSSTTSEENANADRTYQEEGACSKHN